MVWPEAGPKEVVRKQSMVTADIAGQTERREEPGLDVRPMAALWRGGEQFCQRPFINQPMFKEPREVSSHV